MLNPFESHPIFRGGQIQTLAAFIWPRAKALPADEYIHVEVSNGDHIELAVNNPQGPVRGTLYLLHGLGGDAKSAYKLRIAQKLLPLGIRVIRHNHRGTGERVKQAKGIYHSGSALDVLAGLKAIQEKWPAIPIGIVGFSLSGAMLLNLLGRHSKELESISELKGAMSVCAPIDLLASSNALLERRNKHIDFFFAKATLQHFLKRDFISNQDLKTKFRRPTLRMVDDLLVAPLGGFRDAAHYYASCSPRSILKDIRLPTLILAAADDPVVPASSVRNIEYSSAVTVRLERSGGHMGFLGRQLTPHGDYRWMDYFIETWAKNLFQ